MKLHVNNKQYKFKYILCNLNINYTIAQKHNARPIEHNSTDLNFSAKSL